jgi:hypothetical protein
MTGDDKWIRSIKDNPAGKVVADPDGGNRWEWEQSGQDETSRLLRKLNNDELAIEQTDLVNSPLNDAPADAAERVARHAPALSKHPRKSRTRDAGGGFDPYDSSGKPRKR